jgi:hypothetical protein
MPDTPGIVRDWNIPAPEDDAMTPEGGQAPAPGARHALILLLLINLFNYIDRQVLAAVEPEIARTFFPCRHRSA